VHGEEKKYFVLGRLDWTRQDKNLLYQHDEPNKPTMEGPLSYVLPESPFASVSTSQQGPPLSIVSLYTPPAYKGRNIYLPPAYFQSLVPTSDTDKMLCPNIFAIQFKIVFQSTSHICIVM
jgi:hypothetical protein